MFWCIAIQLWNVTLGSPTQRWPLERVSRNSNGSLLYKGRSKLLLLKYSHIYFLGPLPKQFCLDLLETLRWFKLWIEQNQLQEVDLSLVFETFILNSIWNLLQDIGLCDYGLGSQVQVVGIYSFILQSMFNWVPILYKT